MSTEKKEDKKPSNSDTIAYKDGREGRSDILGTDSQSEAQARQRGKEDKINADQTKKEQKESKKDE